MDCTVSGIAHRFVEVGSAVALDRPHSQAPSRNGALRERSNTSTALTFAYARTSSRRRCAEGVRRESDGLRAYEALFEGTRIVDTNVTDETFDVVLRNGQRLTVNGRVDGIVSVDGDDRIIEHKYRTRGLLAHVPQHERVQCELYMRMKGVETCDLVQTFGKHIRVHTLRRDDALWRHILDDLLDQIVAPSHSARPS